MDEKVFKSKFAAMLTGDKVAFTDIYNEMKTPVFTVILRIVGGRADAEDIMQDLFLRLLRHGEDNSVKNPRAYMFTMAHNMAIDFIRKKKTEELDENLADSFSAVDNSCEKADIERAISRLTPEQRTVITLRINVGLTFGEISKILSLPVGTVAARYYSAVGKLKKML